MRIIFKEDPRAWRNFCLQACGLLLLAAAVMTWRQKLDPKFLAGLAVGLVGVSATAIARPAWFRAFYRLGMTTSAWLGEHMGAVILFAIFFLLLLPVAWMLKLAGHDSLGLKRPRGVTSHWRPAVPGGRLDRMF